MSRVYIYQHPEAERIQHFLVYEMHFPRDLVERFMQHCTTYGDSHDFNELCSWEIARRTYNLDIQKAHSECSHRYDPLHEDEEVDAYTFNDLPSAGPRIRF